MDLAAFVAKWSASGASERANKDHFLLDLCDVLEVPQPSSEDGRRHAVEDHVLSVGSMARRRDAPRSRR